MVKMSSSRDSASAAFRIFFQALLGQLLDAGLTQPHDVGAADRDLPYRTRIK
jgi:hypothetical protein